MQIAFDSCLAWRVRLLRERKPLRPHRAQQFRAELHAVRQRQPRPALNREIQIADAAARNHPADGRVNLSLDKV
jgi:hypothetical protein